MRAIISTGGTGGHIFPAIAIANYIKAKDDNSEILFVGAKGKMEMEKVPASGYKIVGLNIVGLQRKKIWKNILLPFKMLCSIIKARKILKNFKPDIVIGVGGYASWATLKEAQSLGIPTLLQEQNSLAGKSNQILAAKAKKICVAYENMDKYFPKQKIVFTGNPIRQNIASMPLNSQTLKDEATKLFSLDKNKLTVLVTGGSLGAGSINKAIENHLQYFIDNDVELLWQTGKFYYDDIKKNTQSLFQTNSKAEQLIHIKEFIFEMDKAYSVSDIVIARAGALSVSELCCVGKPCILVPSPNVAEDHQTKNAMALANKDAAIVVRDERLNDELVSVLDMLVKDEEKRKILSENILKLAVKDADQKIYEQIVNVINNKD